MSGHSRWSNIKRKKEHQDKKKSNIHNKIIQELRNAVQDSKNPSKINLLIKKAKQHNISSNIYKKILYNTHHNEQDNLFSEIYYEIIFPKNIHFLILSYIKNKNKFLGDIKNIINKYNGMINLYYKSNYIFLKKNKLLIDKKNITNINKFLKVLQSYDTIKQEHNNYYKIIIENKKFSLLKKDLQYINIREYKNSMIIECSNTRCVNENDTIIYQNIKNKILLIKEVKKIFSNIKNI